MRQKRGYRGSKQEKMK